MKYEEEKCQEETYLYIFSLVLQMNGKTWGSPEIRSGKRFDLL